MYSPLIVDKRLFELQKQGIVTNRRPIDECRHIASKLTAKLYDEEGEPRKSPTGTGFVRMAADEAAFTKSEVILCKTDFRYFAERYGCAEKDAVEGGGVGPVEFWQSQERALEIIAHREELNHQEYAKYGSAGGIYAVWHKTRQQGATAIMRLINAHRMCTNKHVRAIAASLDEDKVYELYRRDKIIIDNLPFYLKPHLFPDVKCQHIGFDKLGCSLLYQQANQQAGVGTGQQFDLSHMTEVALWAWPARLQFDFWPAVPKALSTFVGFESTAASRGDWWHKFTESIRKREKGFETWIYLFTPHYINAKKNAINPPEGWEPSDKTKEHADLIERTSHEFSSGGMTIRPTASNLYWWESEYNLNRTLGTLSIFFSNYPATPEQSFQYHANSALPVDVIDWMRQTSLLGMPYELDLRT